MNTRFAPIPFKPGHPAPGHVLTTVIPFAKIVMEDARAQPDFDAMDDTMSYNHAARDRLTDDQVETLNDEADKAAHAEALEDVQHELRRQWARAIEHQNALSTPRVPTVDGQRVVMVPITVVVGDLLDAQWSVQLVADALRTGDTTNLHLHLRTTYVDAYAHDLAKLGWRA